MKLIGRRSVASVMRWILGFLNVFISGAVLFCAGALIVALIDPDFGAGLLEGLSGVTVNAGDAGLSHQVSLIAAVVGTLSTWWVINRLRRIFLAVNQGDAFEPANVNRLRGAGLGLIGVQISTAILTFSAPLAEGAAERDYDINLGAWLGILIVFMLAEVFRQGAAMRDDAQMTV
ncbi:hypothetical protein BZG35_04280 [Brevundimonas sp. LM2]|uniref:DUF2975 domain-containing protein n=1 Tax=Brevundimonas sp. LM2 TaxID=1938605 RepID=UPI000983DAB6|nr:DUF2975 domain-containing protein [Brevundimonas sp. LM2]AQR60960.1 hypothetical protein BZG35_04280 [Brevundimonas sp. LM2]